MKDSLKNHSQRDLFAKLRVGLSFTLSPSEAMFGCWRLFRLARPGLSPLPPSYVPFPYRLQSVVGTRETILQRRCMFVFGFTGEQEPFYCRCSAQNAALCKSPPSLRLTVLSISRASWTRSRTHAFVSRAGKTNAPVAGLQDFPSFIIADAQSETDVNFATAPPRYYLYRLIWRVAWSSAQLDKPRKKPDSRVAPCKLCSS